jgi:hypothetical protein
VIGGLGLGPSRHTCITYPPSFPHRTLPAGLASPVPRGASSTAQSPPTSLAAPGFRLAHSS